MKNIHRNGSQKTTKIRGGLSLQKLNDNHIVQGGNVHKSSYKLGKGLLKGKGLEIK